MGNLETRLGKLEAATCANEVFDMKALTNDELLALRACYTNEGRLIPERVTPELVAALERVKR